MSYTEKYDVIVNKITKENYDAKVASGEITDEMIANEVWYFTDDQFLSEDNLNKLLGVDAGAQVNIIEAVQLNGVDLPVNAKKVNVVVPTKLSELTNDGNYVVDENYVHTDYNYTAEDQVKLEEVDKVKHSHENAGVLDATTASYTSEEKIKLGGVAAGAQVNVIESISVNGENVAVDGKNVDIQLGKTLVRIWN